MTLRNTKQWFEEAVQHPTFKNFNVQLGCHIEEFLEMLDAIEVTADGTSTVPYDWAALRGSAKHVADALKSGELRINNFDPFELLDGLVDQRVTAMGIMHMVGYDAEGATKEVDDSNFSKFVDGKAVFNENGKIAKGPSYFKPNLVPFMPADPKAILEK